MTYTLKNNQLKGLVSLIVADGLGAGSKERETFIKKVINKIGSDRDNKMNAIRLYFGLNPQKEYYETDETRIFSVAKMQGLTVVADSVDTAWNLTQKQRPPANTDAARAISDKIAADWYQLYLEKLYAQGVRIFCIDDSNRYTSERIATMAAPILALGSDTYVIASSAVLDEAKMKAMHDDFITLKHDKTELKRIGLEFQLYRQGESTIWVERWCSKYPWMVSAAVEAFRDDSGKMTTVRDLKTMGKFIIASTVPNIAIYAQDRSTNLIGMTTMWNALIVIVRDWIAARSKTT